jgi:hypothetical protein
MMRRLLPLITAVVIALVSTFLIVTPLQPASAETEKVGVRATRAVEVANRLGCSDPHVTVGNYLRKDIYTVGLHEWSIRATSQDCDGFDRITTYTVRMEKLESGACGNGGFYRINNYDFNPNALGYYNPGTLTLDCESGKLVYRMVVNADIRVNSNDPENQRCIGAAVQVDTGPLHDDYNGTVPSICWNGL